MSKQLIKELFKLVNGQPVSSRSLLSLIYRDLENSSSFSKYPALCFARHLQSHSKITRDPFAYESLLNMIKILVNNINVQNYTTYYSQLTNSALPLQNIAQSLDVFCQNKISKKLTQSGFINFINDFLESFDDSTLVSFDTSHKLYKSTNMDYELKQLFDSQPSSNLWQITKFNKLIVSRELFWDKGESIVVGINIDILELPKFNGTIIRELEQITLKYELARLK